VDLKSKQCGTTRDKNSGENLGKIIFADTFSGKVSNNKSDRQVSWLVTADLPSHPPAGGQWIKWISLAVTYSCPTARELHTVPY